MNGRGVHSTPGFPCHHSIYYLQVSVAEVNACPRTVLLLLIVAEVAAWQVTTPWLLMGAFVGSEDDHTPMKSAIYGQLPFTDDVSENCA